MLLLHSRSIHAKRHPTLLRGDMGKPATEMLAFTVRTDSNADTRFIRLLREGVVGKHHPCGWLTTCANGGTASCIGFVQEIAGSPMYGKRSGKCTSRRMTVKCREREYRSTASCWSCTSRTVFEIMSPESRE